MGQVLAQKVIENIPAAIFILSYPELTFDMCNESFMAILEMQGCPGDVLGKQFREVLLHESGKTLAEMIEECLVRREAVFMPEAAFPYCNGEVEYYNLHVLPMKDDNDEIEGIICVALTASSQGAKQEAATLPDIKDEFFAVTAHELRTPVTVLQLYLNLLREKKVTPERYDNFLDLAYRQSICLNRIIQDFLEVSRRNQVTDVLQYDWFDLVEAIREIIFVFQATAGQKFLFNHPPGKTELYGDATRLEQVFFNVIENAVKYSGADSIIRIDLEKGGKVVSVKIKDEGIGIPENEIPYIFGRFYRAQNSKAKSGMGIGLFVAQDIVKLHGGEITVQSEPGRGTTFTIKLPCSK